MFDDSGQRSFRDLQQRPGVLILVEPSLLGLPEEMRGALVIQIKAIGARLWQPAYRFIGMVKSSDDIYHGGEIFLAPTRSTQHESALVPLYSLDKHTHQQLECGQYAKVTWFNNYRHLDRWDNSPSRS